jgi:hypothetical protein
MGVYNPVKVKEGDRNPYRSLGKNVIQVLKFVSWMCAAAILWILFFLFCSLFGWAETDSSDKGNPFGWIVAILLVCGTAEYLRDTVMSQIKRRKIRELDTN